MLNRFSIIVLAEDVGTNPWVIITVAFVAALMGMGVIKLLGYLRKRDADKEAQLIIDRAEMEANSRRKEAEVEAKEMALREKTRIEEQLNESRQKLFDRERQLDKQQDMVAQRSDQLQKQEKMVESNQRKLSEKLEDANRRQSELDDLLDIQRQTLHKVSGLGAEEAKNQLLQQLSRELANEQGALIIKREKELAEICDAKAKETLITALQRFAA
ncbi:MAG TPA: Rnase Y domain-containing protein, partial [Lacipirellulaceae bacterium]